MVLVRQSKGKKDIEKRRDFPVSFCCLYVERRVEKEILGIDKGKDASYNQKDTNIW